jgi:hypothetical protein
VTSDHRLELQIPASIPPVEVEVIVLRPEPLEKPRARRRNADSAVHPAAGMWADRKDLGDTVSFVSKLRERLETRHDVGE